MTVAMTPQLTPALQELINLRLDTIDRILLNRVPRPDRLGIVAEVETQIFELLGESYAEEPTREVVLAVLARLDPPEAYVPEDSERAQRTGELRVSERRTRPARNPAPRLGTAGGILGICALALVLTIPLIYLMAAVLESEELMILGIAMAVGLMFLGGIVALVFSLYARLRGAWSVVGVVTGAMAIVLSLLGGMLVVLGI